MSPQQYQQKYFTNREREEILSALRKKGWSVAKLSRHVGLASNTLAYAMNKPWPKGELCIAGALGVHPADIWPKRYFDEDNEPIKKRFAFVETLTKEIFYQRITENNIF